MRKERIRLKFDNILYDFSNLTLSQKMCNSVQHTKGLTNLLREVKDSKRIENNNEKNNT